MKVFLTNTFYYPNMEGGAEQSTKLLAEGLISEGKEVCVYCVDNKENGLKHEKINQVEIFRSSGYRFKVWDFYKHITNNPMWKYYQKFLSIYNKKCYKEFYELCKKNNPDIVHTNSMDGLSLLIWKAAYELNIPIVHTIRDRAPISPYTYGHTSNKFVEYIYRKYYNKISKYVTAVTAPSNYTLSSSLAVGAFSNSLHSQRVFNSVDYNSGQLSSIINEKQRRSSNIIKFMYAGRLIEEKGIKSLLKAFSNLKQEAELHICGSGELSNYIKQLSKMDTRIKFHGKLSSTQLNDIYDMCDVLVVPSEWPEPFGRVLIEGNLHGLPVIASNIGGIPEIVSEMHGGVLFESGNVEMLNLQMSLFTNRQYINKFLYNISSNMHKFKLSKQLQSFNKIYEQLLNK